MAKALLVVDIQNDFLPGGALPVDEGNRVIPIINELMEKQFDLIVASKDWHPACHVSFASTHHRRPAETIMVGGEEQTLWPDHCVQDTVGSEFAPELQKERIHDIVYKGTDPLIDSYSAFYDNKHRRSTGLAEFLRQKKIDTIYIAGLATDYCVKFSVLDALREGFKIFVVKDACRGVNINPHDSQSALDEMVKAGAVIINSFECMPDV